MSQQQNGLTRGAQQAVDQNGQVVYLTPQTMYDPRAAALAGGLTEIATVAGAINRIASQIPWWAWVGGTAYLVYKYGGRRG